MNSRQSFGSGVRGLAIVAGLALACPAVAQDPGALQNFRNQYDIVMANFEQVAQASGNAAAKARAAQGREAMQALSEGDLAKVYSRTRVPDLSVVVQATRYVASRAKAAAAGHALAPVPSTPGLPGPGPIQSQCNSVDYTPGTRYGLLIAKEVANSVLAAAAWVCNEDVLGENGSLACVPLAIAADVANGFADTAEWCNGEAGSAIADASFSRLQHIHDDLEGAITTIVNNDNANTNAIVNNNNANTAAIVNNDNTNTTTIINNANGNKTETLDLILRTEIEDNLAGNGEKPVALFETPTSNGGYLDLVGTIVAQTIANIQSAGGHVGDAASDLAAADASKAAGRFKKAYGQYREAYQDAAKSWGDEDHAGGKK